MTKCNQDYYIKNRVKICKRQVDIYMPNSIKKIGLIIPDEIMNLYNLYPFDVYGDPYLKAKLKDYGIRKSDLAFDECYDAAMIGYIYSIHRCAYMKYAHIENYIKFMIRCCIKIGVVLAYKERYAMSNNNFKIVYLDDERNNRKI